MTNFISLAEAAPVFRGKSVAVVGGGPSVLDNAPGFVDGFDVVVRMNNYRLGEQQGRRCDVHYSYYGNAIRKTREELQLDGVRLLMCKVPNDKPLECEWHERHGKQHGIDFRWIYSMRKDFWFCDVYVPTVDRFLEQFELLGKHVATTGFAAILDVLACDPSMVYLTGFDGFASKLHNVNERWRPGDPADPIRHRPDLEMQWIADNAHKHLFMLDPQLSAIVNERRAA